ncbi:hypothetical protein ACRN9C_20365 [Shewanella frigidimarina]|uniref:hypothetical protein n=1 Tax=Shewanella frigidimarina TaxID=56812 RepID=UPI003D7B3663
MTTVAYIHGEIACDSLYSFPVNQQDRNEENLTNIAKNTLFNSEKYSRFHVPKAIKYLEDGFEIICGVASEARFFGLTHDHLQYNFGNIGLHLNPNHPEYIIDELSTLYDFWYSRFSKDSSSFRDANPPDVPFLYLLLVVNGISSVYYYLPQKKALILDDDQFPAIGTGRAYIKEYISNNPTHNVIDALTYAINKDGYSGHPIHASISSGLIDKASSLPLLTITIEQPTNYRESLEEGVKLLNEEVLEIKEKMNGFKPYIK